MHEIDVRELDLNLLVTLDVLLDERHVTRSAERLGRSQSAVSHALARLRDQLDDPILVRIAGRMEPTARAQQLGPEIKRVLQTVRRLLRADVTWEPKTSRRTFRLVAPDFVTGILPRLIASLLTDAPSVHLELLTPARGMLRDVALGRFDLAIAPSDLDPEEGVIGREGVTLPWAVFARRDHPAVYTWGLEAWLAYPHIRIRTPADEVGPIDRALETIDRTRQPGPSLPHFMLAPGLLTETDLLLTVPRGVLAGIAARFDLVELACPIELPPIRLDVYESALSARDPATAWFRRHVETCLLAGFAHESSGP